MAAQSSIKFEVEFDPFKDYIDVPVDLLGEENWRHLAKENFGETEAKRKEGIKILKEKAAEANLQLTFFDDLDEADRGQAEEKFWLMVLRAGGMDPAAAFKVLKNYLSLRNAYPQYFAASAPPRKLKPVYEEQVHNMLQHRDQHGRRVYVFRPGRWNPDKVHFNDIFCGGYAMSDMASLETKTQIAGITVVSDASGFGFKQLRNFTLDHARSATHFVQDSFPLWYRSIHVVNAPRLFHIAFALVRPFLNERMKNNLWFHDSFQELHKYVPKEILPEELGGDQGAYDNTPAALGVYAMEKHFLRVDKFVKSNANQK